jgi:hypothetical protein
MLAKKYSVLTEQPIWSIVRTISENISFQAFTFYGNLAEMELKVLLEVNLRKQNVIKTGVFNNYRY